LPFRIVKQNPTIRKFISLLLLLVFLISAAPKAYFHDLVADHKDSITTCSHTDNSGGCIHQSAINCHFDQLVVTGFFDFNVSSFQCQPPLNSAHSFSLTAQHLLTNARLSSESRGPPAIISFHS
jgi:hypothetical protein